MDFLTQSVAMTRHSSFARGFAASAWVRIAHLKLLFLAAMFVSMAHGQPLPRPTVTKASDVFESLPQTMPVDSRLSLRTKDNPGVRRLVEARLQVRIFTLATSQDKPESAGLDGDDCEVFQTVVFPLSVAGRIATLPVFDAKYLKVTDSLDRIQSGKYYLVFEKVDQAVSGAQRFRLKRLNTDKYFATGFPLVVENAGLLLDKVKKAYFDGRDEFARLNKGPGEPCYTYEPIVAQESPDTQIAMGALESCAKVDAENVAM